MLEHEGDKSESKYYKQELFISYELLHNSGYMNVCGM